MKALILAAGYATRLYPITLNQPKPLLKIGGRPLVEYIIDKIKEVKEIKQIYIVTNNKFTPHFEEWASHYESDIQIKTINDGTMTNEDRLGAIGDINFVIQKENINEDFLVLAGDTLFDLNLNELVKLRNEKQATIKVVKELPKEKIANTYGNVIQDENNKIIYIQEVTLRYARENYVFRYEKVILFSLKYADKDHILKIMKKENKKTGYMHSVGVKRTAHLSHFIHPVFDVYYNYEHIFDFHLAEHLLGDFKLQDVHIEPLKEFLDIIESYNDESNIKELHQLHDFDGVPRLKFQKIDPFNIDPNNPPPLLSAI